ncbi:MAG TPA: acyl carrier protein [Casimicrobiaceae bacterium]
MKAAHTKRIMAIVAEVALRDPGTINTSTRLYSDLGLDSLSALELLVAIEDEFSVEIDTDAAKRIKTVGDLVELLSVLVDAPVARKSP